MMKLGGRAVKDKDRRVDNGFSKLEKTKSGGVPYRRGLTLFTLKSVFMRPTIS